jgi:hypothetical protein
MGPNMGDASGRWTGWRAHILHVYMNDVKMSSSYGPIRNFLGNSMFIRCVGCLAKSMKSTSCGQNQCCEARQERLAKIAGKLLG